MKKLIPLLLSGFCVFSVFYGQNAFSQTTNQPPTDLPTALSSLPQASFTNTTLEISAGTVMHGASTFENSLDFRYLFGANGKFGIGAEIQNGTASSVVDAAGLFGEVRLAWDNTEVYGLMGGRRRWNTTPASWEGFAGVGVAYRPFTNGVMQKLAVYLEQEIVVSRAAGQPAQETHAGLRFAF